MLEEAATAESYFLQEAIFVFLTWVTTSQILMTEFSPKLRGGKSLKILLLCEVQKTPTRFKITLKREEM